jgi:hypothetical protein
MDAIEAVLAAGLEIRADGETLYVSPPERLTPRLADLIRANKSALLTAAKDSEREARLLIAAINRACDLRGDGDANRAGLIDECAALPPAAQKDMRAHFQQVVELHDRGLVDRDLDARALCATCQHGRSVRCPNGRPLPPDVMHHCHRYLGPKR